MELIALTPEKELYKGQIQSIKVPGTNGQFEILNGHAAIVAALSNGVVRILDQKGEKITFNIQKGFIEVLNNEVSLLIQAMAE
jgi:F-type H+-transporting ATPase subunit epsilon